MPVMFRGIAAMPDTGSAGLYCNSMAGSSESAVAMRAAAAAAAAGRRRAGGRAGGRAAAARTISGAALSGLTWYGLRPDWMADLVGEQYLRRRTATVRRGAPLRVRARAEADAHALVDVVAVHLDPLRYQLVHVGRQDVA